LSKSIQFIGKSIEKNRQFIGVIESKVDTVDKNQVVNNERFLVFENELDQIHKRMDGLHLRTDMNIKGKLIEELDQIPNIVANITSIPSIELKLEDLIKRIDEMNER